MVEALLVKENIVHLGAALYLAGFLFRDQILLRALVIAGDLVYISYFYFAPEVPLWGGIFWSSVGGFKRSSQHLNEGGCDGHSKATITPFWTSAIAVTGTAASSGAI